MRDRFKTKWGLLVVICSILFCNNIEASTIDNIVNERLTNGKMIINSVLPNTEEEARGYMTYKMFGNNKTFNDLVKNSNGFSYGFSCKNDCSSNYSGVYTLSMCIGNDLNNCENKDIEVEFDDSKINSKIANKVTDYLEKFPKGKKYNIWPDNPYEHVIYIDDIELINYISMKDEKFEPVYDLQKGLGILNYNSDYRKLTNEFNLAEPWGFAGNGLDILLSNSNYLIYEYNGIIYGKSDFRIRTFIFNAIYINETIDTSDSSKIISAVKSRLDIDLGKNVNVTIGDNTYLNSWITEIQEDYLTQYGIYFDESKVLDQVVNININGNDYPFIVIKDSAKVKKIGKVKTKDLVSNSSIEFDSKVVPSDSSIKFTQNYQNDQILNKLNIKEGNTYDISLYSNTKNDYISNSGTNKFKVTIPVSENLKRKNLAVYYIDNEGNIEKYELNVEGEYATFETNHFSEYTIGVSESNKNNDNKDDNINIIDNPKTFDGIMNWIGILLFSISAILIIVVKRKKYN